MRLIDADKLGEVKFHSLPYAHITPSDVEAGSYRRGWNDAIDSIDSIIDNQTSIEPEIIRCKDCRKHNVSSGYKNDCCPLYEWRGISYGHEHDYQYCCFAERRTDATD